MPLKPRIPTPTAFFMPVKRGQSRQTTLTESSYPTEKPGSSYNHGVPTVGGSVGGFIGLVVGLGILAIITTAAAIFFIRRRRRAKSGGGSTSSSGGGFLQSGGRSGGGLFGLGRKRSKGWMQTQSYTDGDNNDISLDAQAYGHKAGAPKGKIYDDPFNAASLDNLQRETSAQIDHGPEYHPVKGEDHDNQPVNHSPTTLAGGTRFKEDI